MTNKIFILILSLIVYSCTNQSESSKRIGESRIQQNKSNDNHQLSYNTLVSDSIIYEFINNVINERYENEFFSTGKCKYIVNNWPNIINTEDSLKIIHADTIFSQLDLEFIFKQNSLRKSFFINTEFLKAKLEIIEKDSLDKYILNNERDGFDDYYKKYGRHGFIIVGLPLFSKDLQTAIIKTSITLAPLNGEGRKVIYKRINNKWKVIYILDSTIS